MKQEPIVKTTKTGLEVVFKSAAPDEAEELIEYLKRTCGETRFLLSEPEDIAYTVESEREFLSGYEQSENSLMLDAYVNGSLAGNGSFCPVSSAKRMSHRCSMGIALFQEFWGQGIGELLIGFLIERAKEAGFEIMELDVFAPNTRALHLYEKLGFVKAGERKNAVKYKDGTYANEIFMALEL